MSQDSDEVTGRYGDGEKEIILLRVPESPFLPVFLCLITIPMFQSSSIPTFQQVFYV